MRVDFFIQDMIDMVREVQMEVLVQGSDLDNKRI